MVLHAPRSAALLIHYLVRLIHNTERHVFEVLHNLDLHKAAKVRPWMHTHRTEIALLYSPPYAPERNLDEYRMAI